MYSAYVLSCCHGEMNVGRTDFMNHIVCHRHCHSLGYIKQGQTVMLRLEIQVQLIYDRGPCLCRFLLVDFNILPIHSGTRPNDIQVKISFSVEVYAQVSRFCILQKMRTPTGKPNICNRNRRKASYTEVSAKSQSITRSQDVWYPFRRNRLC